MVGDTRADTGYQYDSELSCCPRSKSIHGVAPIYLQGLCTQVDSVRGRLRLRSASTSFIRLYQEYKHLLHSGVSHTMDRQFGTVRHQHVETVACHLHTFKQRLKTYLFAISTPSGAFDAFLRVWRRYIRLLTYLFTYFTYTSVLIRQAGPSVSSPAFSATLRDCIYYRHFSTSSVI